MAWQPDPAKASEYYKNYSQNIKKDFIKTYGGKCACCGETIYEFLTIEHKQGQHGRSLKETGRAAYKKALAVFRPDLYEVLCMNCNLAKGMYGECPHKTGKRA